MGIFSMADEHFMQRALDLAVNAMGRTSPNPMVGCVIVKGNQIIGEGYHQKAGSPHAEVHALSAAGELANGATAYVTLEPCSHFGRTPPCADALIRAGIKRVVIAMVDPNPLVAGRGIARLKDAGINVDIGLLANKAARLNEVFIKAITTGLPLAVYKSAFTLDGKIATETGDSKWISNEKSREYVQHLRNSYDVIMVGSETVLRDDPALNCRIPDGRDPVRLVVDGTLRIPEDAKILISSTSSPCIIAVTEAAPKDKITRLQKMKHVEVWQYSVPRYVPLKQLFKDLMTRNWTSVLLEGGGNLAGALIQNDLIDKIDFFIAPKLIGGHGPSPLTGLHIQNMTEAIPLPDFEVNLDTGDIHITGYLHKQTNNYGIY